MTPLISSVLQAVIRWALGPVVEWLVNHGMLNASDRVQFLAELVAYGGSLVWAIYAWWKAHQKQATTVAVANMLSGPATKNITSADVDKVIKDGDAAPAATPSNAVPVISDGTGDGLANLKRLTGTGAGLLLVGFLALSSVSLPACTHTPPSVVTAQGQAAFHAEEAVHRLGDLQTVVIAGNKSGLIADATATRIVQFTVASITTLKTTPAGWQATVATGWAELKSVLPPTTPNVTAALNAVDLALALIGGAR
jgi:hypothetical protein